MNRSEKARAKRAQRRHKFIITFLFLAAAVAGVWTAGTGRAANDADPERSVDTGVRDAVIETGEMTELVMGPEDMYSGTLALVNNDLPCAFPEGGELKSVFDEKSGSYLVRDKNVLLNLSVITALNSMLDDFKAETGIGNVNVISGYRSLEDQRRLYDKSLEQYGQEHTDRFTAKPGGSEHHTGLAVDFGIYYEQDGSSAEFDGEGEYAWITENAWKYGFIRRYESGKEEITGIGGEAWHFRYVGIPHAYIMEQYDLCLEEYINLLKLKPYSWDGEHLLVETLGQEYEIYYCAGDTAHVPETGSYSISGDNIGGFIVTVEK